MRLPFLSATLVPVLLGTITAWNITGTFSLFRLFLITLSISLIHIGANLSNDFFDFRSRADIINTSHTPFSGGSRVITEALISPEKVGGVAFLMYAIGMTGGFFLAWNLNSPLLAFIFACGSIIGFAYTAPPLKFAYRGCGEIANALVFGPFIVIAASLAQTGTVTVMAITASVLPGLLLALLLLINEFPDHEADAAAKKRNLVVRFGKSRALSVYNGGIVAVYTYLIVTVAAGLLPLITLIALITVPMAIAAARIASLHLHDLSQFSRANALTYQLHAFFGLLLCTGILVNGWT